MKLKYFAVLVLSIAAISADFVFAPTNLYTHAAEPPTASTDAPGQGDCTSCHSGTTTFNSGSISTSSSPTGLFTTGYTPGQVYAITFTLANTAKNYGFEMTCLNASNKAAGTFAVTNTNNTSLQTAKSIQYIGHKNANTTFSWTFNWTAPASGSGALTFYSVGLLGNDNGSDGGDLTQAKSFVVNQAVTATCALTVGLASTNVSCNGGKNGTATATAANGTTPYTYTWSNNAGNTTNVTGLAAGAISVTVTDAASCTATASVTVTQPAALTATSSFTGATCGLSNGSATVTPAGGTGAYKYSWNTSPAQSTAKAANIPAGSYTVTVTDANNCSITSLVTVTQPAALTVNTKSTSATCGLKNGSAIAIVGGGTPAYKYSWNTNPVQTTDTALGIAAGSYTVTVTDANSCTAISSVTVTGPAVLSATTAFTGATCGLNNGSASVTATGGTPAYKYVWSTNPLQTTDTATNIAAGNYTVTVTDANSCTATALVTVTGPVALSATSAFTNATCNLKNGSATVNVTGGAPTYKYVWNNSPVQTTAKASNLGPGIYMVTVTDENNCLLTKSDTIVNIGSLPDSAGAITGNTAVCPGTDAYSVDSVSGINYAWSLSEGGTLNSTTGAAVIVTWTAAGNHILSVIPSDSCGNGPVSAINVHVNDSVPSAPIISGNTAPCESQFVYTIVPETGDTYSWAISGGGSIIANDSFATVNWDTVGNYTISVTPTNSCSTGAASTLSIAVNNIPPAVPVVSGPANACSGTSGTYSINASSYSGGVACRWFLPQGGTLSADSGLSISVTWNTTGNFPLKVIPITNCGVGDTGVFNVTVSNGSISAGGIIGDTMVCLNSAQLYSIAPDGADTNSWSFQITGTFGVAPGTIQPEGDSAIITWINSGVYTLYVTPESTCGSGNPDSISVHVIAPPQQPVISGADTICENIATLFTVTAISGETYTWRASDNGIVAAQDSQATVRWASAGLHSITVIASNSCGADTSIAKQVLVRTVPDTPVITGSDSICSGIGSLYKVAALKGETYVWTASGNGVVSQQDSQASIHWVSTGIYNISVVPSNSCGAGPVAVNQVFVGTTPAIPVISGSDSICNSAVFAISPVKGETYIWSAYGNGVVSAKDSQATITWASAGLNTISVTATNTCGTSAAGVKSVYVRSGLGTPVISGPDSVCKGVDAVFTVNSVPGETFTWAASYNSIVNAQNTQATIHWNSAGLDSVTVTASNICGNSIPAIKKIVIQQTPDTPKIVSADSICYGASALFSVNNVPGEAYNWSASDSGLVYSQGSTANVLWDSLGAHSVSVTASNTCGTSPVGSAAITEWQIPSLNLGSDTLVCDTGFVVNVGNGYANYLWSTGQTTDSIIIDESNQYSVTVTTNAGCITTGTRNIDVFLVPLPTFPELLAACDSVFFDPGQGYDNYAWSNGINTEAIEIYQTGAYTLTLTSGSCQVSETLNARIDQEPLAGFTDSVNGLNVSFTDTSTDAVFHYWDFGDSTTDTVANPVHTYSTKGLYHVILKVVNACDSNSYLHAVVVGDLTGIEGINDLHFIDVYPNPVTSQLTIATNANGNIELLNETGEKVYTTKTIDGQPMQVDMSTLPSGLYIVRFSNDVQTFTRKVMKL